MAVAHRFTVAGTRVEVEELGAGAPAVVVQTALDVDELEPLSRVLGKDLHVWHLRRPGYAGSGPARVPGSVAADADLVASLVDHLDTGPAHVVGASYSAAVALTLATRHPEAVRSLALVEPPPHGTAGAGDFRAASAAFTDTYTRSGEDAALEQLMVLLDGRDWRADAERDRPGSVATMERGARTFFTSDLPALVDWTLDDEQAAGIRCPVLLVGGASSHPWFAEMLDRLQRLVADPTRVTIAGAGHSAALTHAGRVGAAVLDHLRDVSR